MTIGLVLSGGGARGVAHIGVLRFLEEKNVKIDFVSGTSAGAIIGGFFCARVPLEQMLEVLKTLSVFRLARLAFSSSGFFNINKITEIYEKYLPQNFEELSIPLYVSATDIVKGKTTFFSSGPLHKAIIASCSVPMLFEPVKFNGSLYIDGGMQNNLPVEPLVDKCDRIIGVHVNPVDNHFSSKNMTKITQRAIELSVYRNVEQRKNYCSLFIEPKELKHVSMYDLHRSEELIQYGYEAIKSKWEEFESEA